MSLITTDKQKADIVVSDQGVRPEQLQSLHHELGCPVIGFQCTGVTLPSSFRDLGFYYSDPNILPERLLFCFCFLLRIAILCNCCRMGIPESGGTQKSSSWNLDLQHTIQRALFVARAEALCEGVRSEAAHPNRKRERQSQL